MILVDTSVWINYLIKGNIELEKLLLNYQVITHEYVIGELIAGNIKNRGEFIPLLIQIKKLKVFSLNEIMEFVEVNNLFGIGLGYIDIQLLYSAIQSNSLIWTLDNKLKENAIKFNCCY